MGFVQNGVYPLDSCIRSQICHDEEEEKEEEEEEEEEADNDNKHKQPQQHKNYHTA